MVKLCLYVFGWMAIFFNVGYTEIATVYSFKEIDKQLTGLSSKTLVVFDVDQVLITSTDQILRPKAKSFRTKNFQGLSKAKIEDLFSLMVNGTSYMLVDNDAPSYIQSLKKRGIKTIALTNAKTEQYGTIKNAAEWRINQLANVGIDFSSSFPNISLSFKEFVNPNELPPIFRQGILFVSDYHYHTKKPKGPLLGAFVDKSQFMPEKVIFIDDCWDYLLSVEEEMKKRHIEFQGFYFKGTELLPESFDLQVAALQWHYVTEKKQWLTDPQAKALLNKKTYEIAGP